MRTIATTLLCFLFVSSGAYAQHTPDWRYEREIGFPEAEVNEVRPYQLTVTDDGTVWVVSSTATDTTAHNSLWKAAPGDATFTLVQDYTDEQVGVIFNVRGITSFANNVMVSSHVRPPSPFGNIHFYPNGDRALWRTFNSDAGNAGYGTYVFAMDATNDGMVYATLSARPSIRLYDFRDPTSATFGNWVSMDPFFNEEQAGHDGCTRSALRDLTLVSGGDYSADTPFYTSRNASPSPLPDGCTAAITGRISVWSGSTQAAPLGYVNTPLLAPGGETDISAIISSGIEADLDGRLWITGPDSTRRWVKAFDISAPLAFEAFELPSSTARGSGTAVPNGAPFSEVVDVALSRSNATAYVADRAARRVFVFQDPLRVANEDRASNSGLRLESAAPNPFRSETTIRFALDAPSPVRLAVYDALGREVAILVDGEVAAGSHAQRFDGSALPNGVYLFRLDAMGQQAVGTMVLNR